jgi:membrane associated rhomboid family serine protease
MADACRKRAKAMGIGFPLQAVGPGGPRYGRPRMTTSRETAPETMRCYRHADRETLLSCSNCERPICTQCMTSAAVGVRCPECAGGSAPSARVPRVAARTLAASRSRGSIATTTLLAAMVVLYLAEAGQAGQVWDVTGSRLFADGAVFGPAIADGDWWRLFTGGFLHVGIIHIAFNGYLLWLLGSAIERYAGTGRFLIIWFSALLWGSVGALLTSPDAHTVGASGGVFGLMAALYLLERQRGLSLLGSSVGPLLVINLVFSFVLPNISWGGHLGGIAGGAAAAFILSGYGRGHLAYGRQGVIGWSACAALLVVAVIAGVATA